MTYGQNLRKLTVSGIANTTITEKPYPIVDYTWLQLLRFFEYQLKLLNLTAKECNTCQFEMSQIIAQASKTFEGFTV